MYMAKPCSLCLSAVKSPITDHARAPNYIRGARRNRIILEQTFLKSYIQLSEATFDPNLRSNVLFIDRLVYPQFDLRKETQNQFLNVYGGATEPVDILMYQNKQEQNEIQNLVMVLLSEN